ncbi:UNVERIFIED_CONTAM: hypothetical protein K2H54_049723 [Gekko kuhli]
MKAPIPIFLTLHNAAEVITCGIEKFVQKEQISLLKTSRVLILLVAAGCLPFCDPQVEQSSLLQLDLKPTYEGTAYLCVYWCFTLQFDADGYFWAVIHLLCAGGYRVYHKLRRPSSLSDSEQQYINYASSVVVLAFASHPTGDLFSALDFPFLYFYSFHSSCCASGLLGFLVTLHTLKFKNGTSSGQYAAWNCLAKTTMNCFKRSQKFMTVPCGSVHAHP